jgi:hypothetical protein
MTHDRRRTTRLRENINSRSKETTRQKKKKNSTGMLLKKNKKILVICDNDMNR